MKLNDGTTTETTPLTYFEGGPYYNKRIAERAVTHGGVIVQLEQKSDGWYVTAIVGGLSTSTATTTYYPHHLWKKIVNKCVPGGEWLDENES